VTRFHAARVGARIERELGGSVTHVAGAYGEFTVLVDGVEVVRGGRLVTGDLPRIIERAREAVPGLFDRRRAYLEGTGEPAGLFA
jgi:hypothetical protein